ncbi:MAG: SPOR domain-containing protein [Nevskia sp.]|nr:SPOR domain-containing protein [Nevskia sp.]
MNDTLKRRLVGLAVLLVLLFGLSWLLPANWPESGEKDVPSTTLPLAVNGVGGEPAAPTPAPDMAAAVPATPDASAPALPATAARPSAPAAPSAAAPSPRPAADQAKPPVPVARGPVPEQKLPSLKLAPALPQAPKPPVPATVKPAEPTAASPALKAWYVQIGSYSDAGNAQTTLNLLHNIGYRGESRAVTSPTGATLYRVRLGPFTSEAAAQQAFDKVTHQGYPQARMLSEVGGRR